MGKELLSGGLHMRNKAELNISADAFFLLIQVPILLLTPKNEKATQVFFDSLPRQLRRLGVVREKQFF